MLSSWLVGATVTHVAIEDIEGLWHISLREADGNESHILYAYTDTVSFDIPINWENPVMRTLGGDREVLQHVQTIDIGIEPILIRTSN
jgi:hypothetical protein